MAASMATASRPPASAREPRPWHATLSGEVAIGDCHAVMIGSAVYAGHWFDPAKGLVNQSRDALAGRPAACVLALILLSGLADDSQHSQAAQQPENPPPDRRDEHAEVRHGQD